MVKKSALFFTSLLLVLAYSATSTALAQEEAAPKISISFADEAEEKPAETTTAPAAQPAPAAPAQAQAEQAADASGYSEEEILFAIYGWFLVHRNQVDMIEVSQKERLAFLSGVNTALAQKEIPGWQDHMPATEHQRSGPVETGKHLCPAVRDRLGSDG